MKNLEKIKKWYSAKTGKEITEFDEYDLHICKVTNEYVKTL